MTDLIFTIEAMQAVRDVMKSCKKLMLTPVTENQRYFLKILEKRSSVSTLEFLKGLPEKEKDRLFQDLFDFAGTQVSEIIPVWTVWKYFGGSRHIKKSFEDIAQMKEANHISNELLLGHTLLPGKITEIREGKIDVVYSNSEIKILIKNININPGDVIYIDNIVLVHFASVIKTNPEGPLVDIMLQNQSKDEMFISACKSARLIDYETLGGQFCS